MDLCCRKTEVTDLLQKLEAQLHHKEEELNEKKSKVAHVVVQWEACFHLVEQFKASLVDAGQDCNEFASEEEIAVATQQVGIGPIMKMYYSNVKKLTEFSTRKTALETKVQETSATVKAISHRLAALQTYSLELAAGKDAVVMRPLPVCYNGDFLMLNSAQPVLPPTLSCSICFGGFPFWDFILCLCQHVYHPWCAVQWFRTSVECAVPECGLVAPHWYNSWGFGQYDKIYQARSGDMQTSILPIAVAAEMMSRQLKTTSGDDPL